jgi:hypothetical protein
MIPTKCRRCGWIIVRNARGQWFIPHTTLPSTKCKDGNPHDPDHGGGDGSGLVMSVAISASVFDAGVI